MGFSWRTKPRSISKAVMWFPEFAKLEGRNWNQKSNKGDFIPVRREYYFNVCQLSQLDYVKETKEEFVEKGSKSSKSDQESNSRNDKTTYEFFGFGYVDKRGIIRINDVGNKIIQNEFDSELFLCQLLKMHFPNALYDNKYLKFEDPIFPFEAFLKAINTYNYVTGAELSLLFGCNSKSDIDKFLASVFEFRQEYSKLPKKNKNSIIVNLISKAFLNNYNRTITKAFYTDYYDGLIRSLLYTGLFTITGRGLHRKIFIKEGNKDKVDLLLKDKKIFKKPDYSSLDDYMLWYGNSDNLKLPWDKNSKRREFIEKRLALLKEKSLDYSEQTANSINHVIKDAERRLISIKQSNALKALERQLVEYQTSLNEKDFINNYSKTKTARDEILAKYEDIKNNDEMSALWLEVNTWKSLIAIDGAHVVKRNFNIEEDLTPKSFAPGIGNTPDMELRLGDYIIIPEVSLMTGVRQWEHEGSSVIDHVQSFNSADESKQVYGLFISSSINIRTQWQFFILNKESWLGKPVSVIPITIDQYVKLLNKIYSNGSTIEKFIGLIKSIHELAIKCNNYSLWMKEANNLIDAF